MRCVVYDPVDLEALTVIDIPQVFIRELEQGKRSPNLSFAIIEPAKWLDSSEEITCNIKCANVLMERFRYRRKETWCAMALNPEVCLLMRSELLPGQRKEDQERRRASFEEGFVKGFMSAINR